MVPEDTFAFFRTLHVGKSTEAWIFQRLSALPTPGARVPPRGPGPTAGASADIPVAGAARGGSPLRHASPLKTGGSVTVQAASPLKTVPATSAPPVPPLPSSGPPLPAGSLSPPPVWRPVVPGAESMGGRLLSPRDRGPQSPQRGTLGGGARQSSAEQLQRNLRVTTTERLLSSQADGAKYLTSCRHRADSRAHEFRMAHDACS